MKPHYADESVTLYHGDSLEVLRALPDGSVNCCVTSPPYFGLRDYGSEGQYGLEETPAAYVETMRALFAEVRRVLADDGTLWLNLGDSYVGAGYGNHDVNGPAWKAAAGLDRRQDRQQKLKKAAGLVPKNLYGIPWRTAFALQDDGWILRAEVIWAKRNCLPDPAKDRPARAHEQVFLFSKKPHYWYDADAIREESDPEQEAHNQRYAREYEVHTSRAESTGQPGNVNNVGIHSRPGKGGRPSRSVWPISAQPFAEAHFAVMPPELARRAVVAGCKPGGVVLDPFSGSGTTGLVAGKTGRRYLGIDISKDYLDLSLRTRLAQSALDFGGIA